MKARIDDSNKVLSWEDIIVNAYDINKQLQKEYRMNHRPSKTDRKRPLEIIKDPDQRKDYNPTKDSIKLLQSLRWNNV